MTDRGKIQWLIGLLVAAGVVYWYEQSPAPTQPGVLSADTRFVPLNVKEPALQVDRLKDLQNDEYTGTHRNIFVAAPPLPPNAAPLVVEKPFIGPRQPPPPPPPPPLQIPVEFYGVESSGGRRVAIFKNGDDPLIVAEGQTFLTRFRLDRVTNNSADVEEISSGRHASLPLVQPDQPTSGAAGGPPGGPSPSSE